MSNEFDHSELDIEQQMGNAASERARAEDVLARRASTEALTRAAAKWAEDTKLRTAIQTMLKAPPAEAESRLFAYIAGCYGEGLHDGLQVTDQSVQKQLINETVEIAADNGYDPGDRLQRILVRIGIFRRTGQLSPHKHIPRGPHASC